VNERSDGTKRGGVTIYQVASRAGVSIATVSRVLRGTARVSPDTQKRVIEAIAELRYTPSRLGRALAERRHAANGIVFPELFGPYYSEVLLGYEDAASDLGRSVLILSTHGRAADRETVLDLASRVDGMVLFDQTTDEAMIEELSDRLPIVLLGRGPVGEVDAVSADNLDSAHALVDHLLGHGFRQLTVLSDLTGTSDVRQRWTAIGEALAERGAPPAELVPCALDEEVARVTAREVLARADRPDILVCACDQIALGAILAAEDLGISIPDDVALTGWDDVMAAKYVRPGLTTVRQPMRELGARAARALDERITGARSEPFHDVLRTDLIVRGSCGPH
jgi:LacI family transcriptional regulator